MVSCDRAPRPSRRNKGTTSEEDATSRAHRKVKRRGGERPKVRQEKFDSRAHVEPQSDYSNADKGAFVMLDKIECMHGAKKAKRKTVKLNL